MQVGAFDFTKVAAAAANLNIDRTPGRILHIDADFLSYHSALPDADGNLRPVSDCVDQLFVQADTLRALAQAEGFKLHFTHPESTKGGRYEAAIQKPYQDNRVREFDTQEAEDFYKATKALVADIRKEAARRCLETGMYLDVTVDASITKVYEADDTLSWAIYSNPEHVLWSGDKDLTMCRGKHLVDGDYYIKDVYGFGGCYLDSSKSQPKVKGYGTSFFWHQMLMGDTADNIQGLITISTEDLNEYFPTKTIEAARKRQEEGGTLTQAMQKALSRGPQPCGPTKAKVLLDGCTSDIECLKRVKGFYQRTYGDDWLTIFWSEAHMLWMTRYEGDTVQNWISEILSKG